ncbi:MAG: WYL domain-containing protein [Clostridia bacterium]|nr:WYL domain-containing protein [Clostridia bacterium]
MILENKKNIRLLKIWELLSRESDEDHPLGTEEIRRRLNEFDIECDRRTLYSDIETLQDAGYEIFCKRSRSNQYYVVDHTFSVPEVLIIMDAVQAASFITEKKTANLINKIGTLAGTKRGDVLCKNVVQFSTVKSDNENIYYSVNEISQAIVNKKQIGFNYFDYDENFKHAYRKDKENPGKKKYYVVNPVATVFSNDNYYMFCYDDKHGSIAQYRVDRMDNVSTLLYDITPNPEVEKFDISVYKKQLFGMYGGDEVEITIEAKNEKEVIDIIHDKFGSAVRLYKIGKNKLGFKTRVRVSPNFIAWCVSFGDKIKLVEPQETVNEVKDYIKSLSAHYKK